MKLFSLFQKKDCVFSLEVFPPKQHQTFDTLYGMLNKINSIPVDYISVTYSAGGSGAKDYTLQIARHIRDRLHIEPLVHQTCLTSDRQEIDYELAKIQRSGVQNILALRGDRSPEYSGNTAFFHASDLIHTIKMKGDFCVAAACYPEGHPESLSLLNDIDHVKGKLDVGADYLITQLFFDNGKYFRFLNLARKRGIHCPVEAGVMPIVKKGQIERTISLSSSSLPSEFTKFVSRYADDPPSFYAAGLDYAIRQIRDLIESGVDGIHLYAMNNALVVQKVYEGIADLL